MIRHNPPPYEMYEMSPPGEATVFQIGLAVSEGHRAEPRGFVRAIEVHVRGFRPAGNRASSRSSGAGRRRRSTPHAWRLTAAQEIKLAYQFFHHARGLGARRGDDEAYRAIVIAGVHHRLVVVGVAFRGVHLAGELLVDGFPEPVAHVHADLFAGQLRAQQLIDVRHHLGVDVVANAPVELTGALGLYLLALVLELVAFALQWIRRFGARGEVAQIEQKLLQLAKVFADVFESFAGDRGFERV